MKSNIILSEIYINKNICKIIILELRMNNIKSFQNINNIILLLSR